jgi:predicted DNA-binding transcriptional regulator AlpA
MDTETRENDDLQILNPQDVCKLVRNISRPTLQRWVEKGEFPPPIQLGGLIGWKRADVVAWLDSRPKGFLPVRGAA